MHKRVLALSSSRTGSGGYLESAVPIIGNFLGNSAATIAFIPFAAADGNYEAYTEKVRTALPSYNIITVTHENAVDAIAAADVIMVGGG
ncbi:MAG: Type 1 glutamine amidotransferase-like domain-containing protein [Ferruginibacter sp.]